MKKSLLLGLFLASMMAMSSAMASEWGEVNYVPTSTLMGVVESSLWPSGQNKELTANMVERCNEHMEELSRQERERIISYRIRIWPSPYSRGIYAACDLRMIEVR